MTKKLIKSIRAVNNKLYEAFEPTFWTLYKNLSDEDDQVDLQEDKDQSHGDILKQRTVKLFNKALDVSIHHYLKSKQDFRHNRQMQIFEQSWDKDEE